MTLWEETEVLQVSAGEQLILIFRHNTSAVNSGFLGKDQFYFGGGYKFEMEN